jgi:hypothetical protein
MCVARHHAPCLQFLHLALHELDLLIDVEVRGEGKDLVEKLLRIGDRRSSSLCQFPGRLLNKARRIRVASHAAA